ncbi:MAG: DegV family protein [Butyribacter sp.]|nr:DegV family protein [bacterium]MDY3854829.1 DegV family protein [Butyribacter sp.]
MSYLILCDSCTDFSEEMEQDSHFVRIPLTLHVGDSDIVDDETFDQQSFLKKVAECPECPKSSCPSPEKFMEYFDQADDIYIVTLSSHLSGSYNSAELAKSMYLDEHDAKNIYVFDSKSASAGQSLIASEIQKRAQNNMPFEQITSEVQAFLDKMGTKFVLETLEMLRKNGRLSNVAAVLVNALNIKPVMSSDGNGQIAKYSQARGMKKAIQRMADAILEDAIDPSSHTLYISHCNNPDRAEFVKKAILEKVPFKNVVITKTGGVSSLYAADGGIVVAY